MKPMIWSYFLQLSNHMWNPISTTPGIKPDGSANPENGTDLETWDKLIDFIAERQYNMLVIDVGDAVKYESHPEISAPDAWDKDFLRKKLDEIRALGITPIPKLNFSTCHDAWMKEYGRMVSTPKYYQVVADVIREVCEVFDYPRYFHLGMDEAHGVGTGKFKDLHGKESPFNIINRHLKKVVELCKKHGFEPMMWSDMYFRCGSKNNDYYDKECVIPKEVIKDIPKEVELVYWDYYHEDKEFYADTVAQNTKILNIKKAYLALTTNAGGQSSGFFCLQ